MIDANGYFDWMIQDPGPLEKTNGGVNTCEIVVPHSAEGYWPYLQVLLHSLGRRASWMFSNLQNGRCYQHYSIYAQVWGSGSGYPNNNGVMWENEGVAGEPFTDVQNVNNIRIIREVSELKGWKLSRPVDANDRDATGYEHNECVRWGSEYTACPSGRVPWDLYLKALNKGGRMYTDAEIDAKIAQALALGVRNQNMIADVANGENAVIDHNDVRDATPKITLKGLWFIAGKSWPF